MAGPTGVPMIAFALVVGSLSGCSSNDHGATDTAPDAVASSSGAPSFGGATATPECGGCSSDPADLRCYCGPGPGGTGGSRGTGGSGGTGGGSPDDAAAGAGGTPPEGGTTTPRQAACPAGQIYGDPVPVAAVAASVMGGFGFTEGPVWVASTGALLFSDMDFGGGDASGPPALMRSMTGWGSSPSFSVFVTSGSNGLGLANDGRILAATHDTQSLSYFDPTRGVRTDWPLLFQGHHFNSPNDLVVRADGNVYFTDPDWQLGSRTSETGIEGVYRVPPSGPVELIDDTFDKPNGITLSPDEQTLYVGGRSGGIQRFLLDLAGTPGVKSAFAPGSTDGMAVDCAGNVYTTSGDVIVFDPAGTEIGRITVAGNPSNVAFGGTDRRTLFITAGAELLSIHLGVPGMPY